MSDKEIFTLLFEYENLKDESYEVVLEKYDENTYSDGNKYFHLSENFIYLIENKKGKKKKVAKRKGNNLVLSNKKDKIIFSPDVVIQQNSSYF